MQKKQLILLAPSMTPDGVIIDDGNPATPQPPAAPVDTNIQPDKPDTNNELNHQDTQQKPPVDTGDPEDANSGDTTSIEDFLNVKAPTDIVPAPVKKEEDTKVEDKTAKPAASTSQPANKQVTQPNARDYTDIAEEDIPLFKNMNNAAFAKLKPVYIAEKLKTKELEETKQALAKAKEGGLPESYYEHEQGYRFDPTYQEAEQNFNLATSIANHWRQQFTLIEEGKDWQDLSWDEQQNKFVLSEPKAANASNRVGVLTAYQKALAAQTNLGEQVNTLRSSFKQRHSSIVEELKTTEESWFPAYKDEKSKEAAFAKEIYSKLPAYVQRNPIGKLLAKSAANNIIQARLIKQLQQQIAQGSKSTQTTKTNVRQNPNLNDMGAHNGSGQGEDEVTMDDFNRIKEVG